MNVERFALETGFHPATIRRACRRGSLPCEKTGKGYEISGIYLPVWKSRKNSLPVKRKKGRDRCSIEYQNRLDRYNRENGTDYSYGVAVAKGVL